MKRKTKVVLVQLGSPKSPAVSDVRKYLKEFLGDPRVVDINPLAWKLILNLFVLPFRPKRSAKAYSRIWEGDGFPLVRITKEFAVEVQKNLNSDEIEVESAFLLSEPRVSEIWDKWEKELDESENPARDLLVIPMFPQYSESTIASGLDALGKEIEGRVRIPNLKVLTDFHKSKAFIDNSVRQIQNHLKEWKDEGKNIDDFVISFHGIPKRRVIYKKDRYYQDCYETFKLIKDRITEIDSSRIHMTFQSRFGSEEWLTPYTDEFVTELVENGHKEVAVYCPSFVADCLETIDEIGDELQHEVKPIGGNIHFIPCLNIDKQWAKDFASFIDTQVKGSLDQKDEVEYRLEKKDYEEMEQPTMEQPPLSDHAKSSLKIVFLTLFLDLVGFSIIFPLFPALAKYYLEVDSQNTFLRFIFDSIHSLLEVSGKNDMSSIVLFGGALGALYSFLQFLAAPLWGVISDRIGRKPVLIVSVTGLALSYLLWFFSGSFTLLILARFIGGIMGGNISTATAVVADVTQKENRAKGMAFIGIAFAFGFIFGPAIGGLLSMIDLTKMYPSLEAYGVNPFSMPAALSFVLAVFNVYWLATKFKETLPPERRGNTETDRSINPLVLFKPLPYQGVNLTNFGHFFFLMAFSGMEFTLTFLAVERLGYSSMDNAYMFIFIGFVIAMIQGGVVRRRARQVGEKKMAIMGLISIIPGLLLISNAGGSGQLYLGLFFLAVGSSMAIPCLTSLVSLYTPAEYQGKSIGIFRSLGALARVVGPIAASLVYWRMGSAYPYLIGSAFLILPIIMVGML
ncbi:MAG: ferrochelatase, partial [Deltaproteobacteria bacterium]